MSSRPLILSDLFGVLLLRQGAVETVARSRETWKVGLGFVCVATLARVYDTEDLARKPWHLVVPLAASITVATLAYLVALIHLECRPSFWRGWLQFLSCFWMTAPAALVYGIPWERVLTPGKAVQINMLMLGVVSVWRGLAVVKIIEVLTGRVSFVAMPVAIVSAWPVIAGAFWATSGEPVVIAGMAGVRLSEAQMFLSDLRFLGGMVVMVSGLIWVWCVLYVLWPHEARWSVELSNRAERVPRSLLVVIGALALPFLGAMVWTQPEVHRAGTVEGMVARGEAREAVRYLASHVRSDFPPVWELPPRVTPSPDIRADRDSIALYQIAVEENAPEWVLEAYLETVEWQYFFGYTRWVASEQPDLVPRLVGALSMTESGRRLLAERGDVLRDVMSSTQPATQGAMP